MFKIGSTPRPVAQSTLDIAARVEPPTIGHWRDQGLAHGIHALTSSREFVGTAFTVRVADMDSTALHHAVDLLEEGHVLVVDMGGDRERACVGAVVAFFLAHKKIAGVVIDGCATDLKDIEASGIPVFARGLSAMTLRVLGLEGDINLPVVIDDVVVTPGQVVIGTADGVLFIDEDDLLAIADDVFAAQDFEPGLKRELAAGSTSLAAASGAAKAMEGKIKTLASSAPAQHL
jgi:4-hydroxy-4-methyl-2-oxoglutarate aldolase